MSPARLALAVLIASLMPAVPAAAQSPTTQVAAADPQPSVEARQRARFPQPVEARILVGRRLLTPSPAQTVLGRVVDVVRGPSGASLVVELAGWFGLPFPAGRLVAVRVDDVALLGEHVVLMDITSEALEALPTFEPAGASAIPSGETIEVGLVKPFH